MEAWRRPATSLNGFLKDVTILLLLALNFFKNRHPKYDVTQIKITKKKKKKRKTTKSWVLSCLEKCYKSLARFTSMNVYHYVKVTCSCNIQTHSFRHQEFLLSTSFYGHWTKSVRLRLKKSKAQMSLYFPLSPYMWCIKLNTSGFRPFLHYLKWITGHPKCW